MIGGVVITEGVVVVVTLGGTDRKGGGIVIDGTVNSSGGVTVNATESVTD